MVDLLLRMLYAAAAWLFGALTGLGGGDLEPGLSLL